MKREIIFASHNPHKLYEIRKFFPVHTKVLGLNDIGWTEEIPEPFLTYEENAKAKAWTVFDKTGLPCFADDSGLEVDVLAGRPGPLSARYAGLHKSNADNMQKVLDEMKNEIHRKAKFICVIAYISSTDPEVLFRGIVTGRIHTLPAGDGGFGYDPIFAPDGFDRTFGQLDDSWKSLISHRARAIRQFIQYLEN